MISFSKFHSFTLLLLLISFIAVTIKTASACTIFTISNGDQALFGNNEDWYNPNTYIWFEMPEKEKLGVVYFGFDDFFPQGGMNENGLCFDANALPEMALNNHPELLSSSKWVVLHIIERCVNISQAIQMAQLYNWGTSMAYQVHFADAFGDAVVISPGSDGEINFTRKNVGDGFLVSTNFNLGYPINGWTPCWRYSTATEMLDDIDHEDNLTVEAIRDILNATHQKGTYATKYSNIFDLVTQDIYIYQNYNFKELVHLNLHEELAKGNEEYIRIEDLFTQLTTQETQTEKTSTTPLLIFVLSLFVISIYSKKNY